MKHQLQLSIENQPSETSCGPTCLAAVYDYWEKPVSISSLIDAVGQISGGGTLAVNLGCDALRRGFCVDIATYNLQLFDPTWFDADGKMIAANHLILKLRNQREVKRVRGDVDQARLQSATIAYEQFLNLGGTVRTTPLNERLLIDSLGNNVPILCGLSATYLYNEARERTWVDDLRHHCVEDDVGGDPAGHFVVLHGYDAVHRIVHVADPLHPNPLAPTNQYPVPLDRLISSILLGIVTHDANLLTITPLPAHS